MESKDLNKDYEFANEKFKNFNGFLSIDDFRTFLLLAFSEDNEENIINRFLQGSNPNKNIFYDIQKKAYTFEMMVPSEQNIVIYYNKPLEIKSHTIKQTDKEFFDKYMSSFEQETLLNKNGSLQIVKYMNKTGEIDKKYEKIPKYEITKIFNDFLSLLFGIGKVKSLFVLDGAENEPDIIFTFTISVSNLIKESYIPINMYIDHDKITKNSYFMKINSEKFEYEGVEKVKEATHSDMFKNQYLLLVHIKSFTPI